MSANLGTCHNQASPLQEDILRFVYQHRARHGQAPYMHQISDHLGWDRAQVRNVRYHLQKLVRLGLLEASLEEAIYEMGRQNITARKYGATHGCGVGMRQGSCPERARKIATLLLSDRHAVDRFARLFCGEWKHGVAL